MPARNALFISHASPEDNPFTIWLGAKLSAFGFDVWADVLRLAGGDDWQRKLESAIRDRACKVLLVANAVPVAKQGVRNEIQIASDVARKIDDREFIIPLRLGAFDAPFLIAHSQYINFEPGWEAGLRELAKTLTEVYAVPRANTSGADVWTNLQLLHGKPVVDKPETLISNWLEVRRLPEAIYYLPPTAARIHREVLGHYAKADYGDGLLTCQKVGSNDQLAKMTVEYLEGGWPQLGLKTEDARRLFTALANQALGKLFELKGLHNYTMANGHVNWWMGKGVPENRVGFRWPNLVGSRQLQGHSSKRGVYWHFGVSIAFRSKPFTHVRVKSRLLFTENGIAPIKSALRIQKLRRSFAKGWRNARWRDMMLAFLYWLGEGTTVLNVPFGDDEDLVLSLPPLAFTSPVSISDATANDDDADDPEVEYADEDDITADDEADDDGEA